MKTEMIRPENSFFCSGSYFVGDLLKLLKSEKELQKSLFFSDDNEVFEDRSLEINIYGQWHKVFFSNTEVGGEAVFSAGSDTFKTSTGVIGIIELKNNAAVHDLCHEAAGNGFGCIKKIAGNFEPEALPGDVFEYGTCVVEEED